ncbi:hypothetical protein M2345_000894 [Sphingobium sp. B8D3D]|nr:hypothetical protein [Sphingobium sp. B8D3D]MCW2416573.1 hypothetical protein [Sphingobium sp. B8D3A]
MQNMQQVCLEAKMQKGCNPVPVAALPFSLVARDQNFFFTLTAHSRGRPGWPLE